MCEYVYYFCNFESEQCDESDVMFVGDN